MSDPKQLEGGCLCGAQRFRVRLPALDAGWCHCRLCQKNSGAAAQAYAWFPREAVTWLRGAPVVYRSSARGERLSCPTCGSPLVFRDADGWSVNAASLDDPAQVPPRRHIWTMSRVPWFDPDDGLPRFRDGGDTPDSD